MSTATSGGCPSPVATGQITLRELVGNRPFLLYLVGQATSGMGSALSSVALVFAVLSISRSAGSVGLVLLASRLPGVVFSLTGGVIADRFPRQRVAAWSDAARTGLQAAAGVLLLSGQATLTEVAALQIASGAAGAVFGPANGALLAALAPRGQLRRASSLLGIVTAVTQTGGLAISGVIVAVAGPGTSLVIDAATFGVSSVTLALVPIVVTARPPKRKVIVDLRESRQVFSQHRWVAVYTVHETIINVLVLSPFFVLGPVIAKSSLGGAPAWSAIALGYVVGNLAAAHLTYHWAPRRPVLAALAVSAALAPMLVLIGLAAPIWIIVPAALLAGAQSTIYNTLLSTALQANLPEQILGRSTAIVSIGSTILVPIGMGLAGLAAVALGTTTVLLSGAGIVLIETAACVSLPATRTALSLDRGA